MATQTPVTCDMDSWKVIFFDDEQEHLKIVTEMFRVKKIPIACYQSVEVGMAALDAGDFNILLLDLRLGGVTGWELQEKIRDRFHDLVGIAFSAFGSKDDFKRAEKEGLYAYILKPVTSEQLFAQITAAVSKFLVKQGKPPCSQTE